MFKKKLYKVFLLIEKVPIMFIKNDAINFEEPSELSKSIVEKVKIKFLFLFLHFMESI